MSILVGKETRLLVQGITGREGAFHTQQMLEYGTQVVAGVTPGKGGEWIHGVPIFDTVSMAVEATGANTSVIYVPAPFAADAIIEAALGGIQLIVCISEGVPALDMVRVVAYVHSKGARLIGPNCPGLITPGEAKVGIMPAHIHREGPVGVVSRSGTLTYEVVYALTNRGIGQSTAVGIGGDMIVGSRFVDILDLFENDAQTDVVVMIGEIGGAEEEAAARFVSDRMTKPVIAFVAGQTAPEGKRMGHAGAIISGSSGGAEAKIQALRSAGVPVADYPEQIVDLVSERL
jgi:succinyl-CoA synthetase alpha subunit